MIINDGQIAQFGDPEEIISRPENGFVRKFILNQLEIKKNNIYRLFAGQIQAQMQPNRFRRPRCRFHKRAGAMRKNREIKVIFVILTVFFFAFLCVPMLRILMQSFTADGAEGFTFANYTAVLTEKGFLQAAANSLLVSACSALITTVLAFILAYTIHYTDAGRRYKSLIAKAAVLPMLLPTITYGFAIIYSFGKQGLLTRLFGRQLFDIYGFNGLLLGYVIYTLPISFMLINNTMGYIDKKFTVVSRLMGDTPVRTFWMTVLQPLLGTLAASFIQTFFLCFTDFGIPASVGGSYEVIASVLYTEMLGSVPNFGNGAVVALVMLVPSVVSITVLTILERYNVRYSKISQIELKKDRARDTIFSGMSALILIAVFSAFLVLFLVPFVDEWPYRMSFTMEHVRAVFADSTLFGVYIIPSSWRSSPRSRGRLFPTERRW